MATFRRQQQQQQQSRAFASPIYTVVVVTLALSGYFHTANAQQDYNNVNGYVCNGQNKTCTAYAIYRTQNETETFASVGALFNLTAADIATDSGKNLTTTALGSQTPLYIRLACGCSSSGNYLRSVGHKVVSGDTYARISQVTYENLTTFQAMENANPTVPATQIQIGSTLNVPLRCACPTASQATNGGTNVLLTYVIRPQESLATIASHFSVTTDVIEAANNVTNSSQLNAFTTLLVPFTTLPPLSSINLNSTASTVPVPAPSPPSSSGAATTKLATITVPLWVSIGVTVFGATISVFGF